MRKAPVRDIVSLLVLSLLCSAGTCMAQLHIGSGTTWVSTSETSVVLDNTDLQYDAGPVLLNNVFRFTGARTSSIRGNAKPLIYAIGLSKATPAQLNIEQDITITKRINFESGLLDLNGQHIGLGPDALLTNENELSRLIGPGGGYIDIDADLHAPVAANPGNLGAFITSATDLGKVNIFRSHNLQYINDTSMSIARWMGVSVPDNVQPFSVTLRFNYFYAEAEGFDNDSLTLWQSGDDPQWSDIAYTARNIGQKYIEKKGLTRLSSFTLSRGTTLPVLALNDITLLTGHWNNDLVMLGWTALTEHQTDHFSVERRYASEDSFIAIAKVPTTAPGGNRSDPAAYTFTDSTAKKGSDNIYYRIHQVTANGQSAYSNIIVLKQPDGSKFIKNCYPTIVTGGQVYIGIGNMSLQKMSFMIIDAKGSIVLNGTLPYQSQWLPVQFLSHGIYRLILQAADQKFHSTFIK